MTRKRRRTHAQLPDPQTPNDQRPKLEHPEASDWMRAPGWSYYDALRYRATYFPQEEPTTPRRSVVLRDPPSDLFDGIGMDYGEAAAVAVMRVFDFKRDHDRQRGLETWGGDYGGRDLYVTGLMALLLKLGVPIPPVVDWLGIWESMQYWEINNPRLDRVEWLYQLAEITWAELFNPWPSGGIYPPDHEQLVRDLVQTRHSWRWEAIKERARILRLLPSDGLRYGEWRARYYAELGIDAQADEAVPVAVDFDDAVHECDVAGYLVRLYGVWKPIAGSFVLDESGAASFPNELWGNDTAGQDGRPDMGDPPRSGQRFIEIDPDLVLTRSPRQADAQHER